MDTNTLSDTSGLSAEELELLAYLLEEEGVEIAAQQTIFPREQQEHLPLSFAQSRLWFLDQLAPGMTAYNVAFAIRVKGWFDLAVFQQSLNEIVRRHEVLRTTFPLVDGQPIQRIAPALEVDVPIGDLRAMPEDQREAEVYRLATREAQQAFDLARGPLLVARVLRLAEDDYVVLLTIHHIVFDGWSIGVFLREIMALYDAFSNKQPSPLPPLPIQYADFALWQRQWLQGEVLAQQLAYWRRQLSGRDGSPRPPVLELPTDFPRPPRQSHRGAHCFRPLPLSLAETLTALSQQEGATLFMTLLAAFNTLLYRYSGQDDILVGSPIANRDFVELERLVGFFVNTLLLRTDLSGEPSFRKLLGRVRETTLEGYAHQNVPFEQLTDELQPDRNLSYNPLFQVMFVLQNAAVPSYERDDLSMTFLQIESGAAMFDLMLSTIETPTALNAVLEYNTDLFEAATMQRFLDHFQVLLEGIAANPDQPIGRLPLLSVAERGQLLIDWNIPTRMEDGRSRMASRMHPDSDPRSSILHPQLDACVHTLFEAQAARTPGAVAVMFETERLSYQELNARANRLAHYLRARGVGPETLVGICMERSPDLIVGLLGILKAGGAYLPLDPNYPAERLAYMLEDSRASMLLTRTTDHQRLTTAQDDKVTRRQEPVLNGVKDDKVTESENAITPSPLHPFTSSAQSVVGGRWSVVELDRDWPIIAQEPAENPASGVTPDNLVYVIYTSGSVGQPKGVPIAHRALVNYTLAACDLFAITEPDRVLQFASISFDTAGEEIYPCLARGATLVLRTEALLSSAPAFLQACDELGLTVLDLPTAYWHQLTAEIAVQGLSLPEALRLVIIGGEQALPDRVELWRQFAPDRVKLINTYGPTEATIAATAWELPKPAEQDAPLRSVPIGRPIGDAQVYLLDHQMQLVPVGVPGELCIGGANLARGYLGRPDLTAERFIPNPFATTTDDRRPTTDGVQDRGWRMQDGSLDVSEKRSSILHPPSSSSVGGTGTIYCARTVVGGRLYRTGDRARWRADGQIEFLGRIDHQVKIRGFRIEPGEIETVLERHPSVRSLAVIAREAAPGDIRLIAYVVPTVVQAEEAVVLIELHKWAQERLPDYMIPAALVVLDALPLTPTGKVDRQALPAPDWSRRALDDTYIAPRSPIEEQIAGLIMQVLGVERVGINDNFFTLGGHSLLATQLVARLRERFGVELPLRSLFEAPTVAGLAERVETIQWMAQSEEVAAGVSGEEYEEGEI